jgi:hypothetical protein
MTRVHRIVSVVDWDLCISVLMMISQLLDEFRRDVTVCGRYCDGNVPLFQNTCRAKQSHLPSTEKYEQ